MSVAVLGVRDEIRLHEFADHWSTTVDSLVHRRVYPPSHFRASCDVAHYTTAHVGIRNARSGDLNECQISNDKCYRLMYVIVVRYTV